MDLEEKPCPTSVLSVTVLHGLTKELIEDALVTLLLTKTPAGPSITPDAPPKYTDANGTECVLRPNEWKLFSLSEGRRI